MAFLLYFIVILVSAASVLFGLDLMSSPLPSTPNVPIGRSAQVTPAHVAKPVREAKRDADSRALSPVYPAPPGAPMTPAQAPQWETNGSAPPRDAAIAQSPPTPDRPPQQPEQQQASSAPAQQQESSGPAQQPKAAASQQRTSALAPSTQSPPAAAASAQSAAAEPAVAQSKGRCNVQACAAAYRSFRASDCSYLPYPGVRQVCTRSGAVATADARPTPRTVYGARRLQPPAMAREATDSHEFDEVTRIVRKMTRGEDGDVVVQDSQGRIIIVHPGPARAYAPYN